MASAATQDTFEGRYTLPVIEQLDDTADEIRAKQERVRALCAERNAILLAHHYQRPEVQEVADAVADLGYVDCTATAFRPAYLADDAPHLQLAEPTWLELAGGGRLLELPTTHSIGMLARGIFARSSPEQVVHAYFHDTDLLDVRRSAALRLGLGVLGRRRTPSDLGELQRGLRPEKTMSFANKRA